MLVWFRVLTPLQTARALLQMLPSYKLDVLIFLKCAIPPSLKRAALLPGRAQHSVMDAEWHILAWQRTGYQLKTLAF